MKYRNKYTETIAEPSAEVEALNFAHNSDWEKVNENFDIEAPQNEDFEAKAPEMPDIPENEGEEESECSQSEETATFQSDMPMNTSEDTTESQAPTETDGKPSAKRKGKGTSKPPVKN